MDFFKKTAVIALAAALLMTGCAGGDTSWAFKSGDIQISAGLYILNQIVALSDAEVKISEEHKDDADFVSPKPSELLKMTIEGKSASEWVNAEAEKSIREHIAVRQKLRSLGFSLTEAEIASVRDNASGIMSRSKEFYESNGVSEASIIEYYTGFAERSRLFTALYYGDGEFAVSEDELKVYFEQNYFMADMMPMYKYASVPEGETKTLDELNAEIMADAEGYRERLQNGEDITELMYEYELKNALEEYKSSIVKPEKESATYVISEDMRPNFGDTITDAVMKSSVDSAEIVEDSTFIVVFKRTDILEDASVFQTYQSAALLGMRGDEYSDKVTEWGAAVSLEANSAALNRYTPAKIKISDTQGAVQ